MEDLTYELKQIEDAYVALVKRAYHIPGVVLDKRFNQLSKQLDCAIKSAQQAVGADPTSAASQAESAAGGSTAPS
jgi:septation ring formation regulator EzrA